MLRGVMMLAGGAALAGCALVLTGCATISYLTTEYGSASRDGEVTTPDGATFWIWQHKSKSKLMVSVDPARAAGMGAVSGLTFGAVRDGIPQPIFEDVAQRWFAQSGRPQCRTVKGYPIDRLYFEFDIDCTMPTSTATPRHR